MARKKKRERDREDFQIENGKVMNKELGFLIPLGHDSFAKEMNQVHVSYTLLKDQRKESEVLKVNDLRILNK